MPEIKVYIEWGLSLFIFRWLSLLKCSSLSDLLDVMNFNQKWLLKEIYLIWPKARVNKSLLYIQMFVNNEPEIAKEIVLFPFYFFCSSAKKNL